MDEVLETYGDQPGALIPILQKAQDIYGYLPLDVLKLISERQGISLGKTYGVATFYSQFYLKRRGKHVLKLCDGTACHVSGTPRLLTAIKEKYGIDPDETTEDGELTLEVVYCLGSCALAPVGILDGEVAGNIRQDVLMRTLSKVIETG
jgi:NADH-quinone oxidoreductase subunit E